MGEAQGLWTFDPRRERVVSLSAYDDLKAQAALFPELVEAIEMAYERLHQLHPNQYQIPVGKGVCQWPPCKRLRETIARAEALMPGEVKHG